MEDTNFVRTLKEACDTNNVDLVQVLVRQMEPIKLTTIVSILEDHIEKNGRHQNQTPAPEIIRLLLSGFKNLFKRDLPQEILNRLLYHSISWFNYGALQTLLDHGADSNAVVYTENGRGGWNKSTPVLLAACLNHDDTLEHIDILLSHGANLPYDNKNRQTIRRILDNPNPSNTSIKKIKYVQEQLGIRNNLKKSEQRLALSKVGEWGDRSLQIPDPELYYTIADLVQEKKKGKGYVQTSFDSDDDTDSDNEYDQPSGGGRYTYDKGHIPFRKTRI